MVTLCLLFLCILNIISLCVCIGPGRYAIRSTTVTSSKAVHLWMFVRIMWSTKACPTQPIGVTLIKGISLHTCTFIQWVHVSNNTLFWKVIITVTFIATTIDNSDFPCQKWMLIADFVTIYYSLLCYRSTCEVNRMTRCALIQSTANVYSCFCKIILGATKIRDAFSLSCMKSTVRPSDFVYLRPSFASPSCMATLFHY